MTPPVGQEAEDAFRPMDLDHIEDQGTSESNSGDCVGQRSAPASLVDGDLADVQPQISSRKTKILSPGQGTALQATIHDLKKTPPSIRGGEHGSCIGQENDYKSILEDENADVQPPISSRRPKVPLAEQGAAFQAALQQSKETAPGIRGSKGVDTKWTKAVRNQAAAAAAENPRLAALKKQKVKGKKARKKDKMRQQMCDMGGCSMVE
ncbi:MAG: hypothetical protein Q9196_005957 [Gyalolechia fulgens]